MQQNQKNCAVSNKLHEDGLKAGLSDHRIQIHEHGHHEHLGAHSPATHDYYLPDTG